MQVAKAHMEPLMPSVVHNRKRLCRPSARTASTSCTELWTLLQSKLPTWTSLLRPRCAFLGQARNDADCMLRVLFYSTFRCSIACFVQVSGALCTLQHLLGGSDSSYSSFRCVIIQLPVSPDCAIYHVVLSDDKFRFMPTASMR